MSCCLIYRQQHFMSRGSPLKCINSYPTMQSQEERYKKLVSTLTVRSMAISCMQNNGRSRISVCLERNTVQTLVTLSCPLSSSMPYLPLHSIICDMKKTCIAGSPLKWTRCEYLSHVAYFAKLFLLLMTFTASTTVKRTFLVSWRTLKARATTTVLQTIYKVALGLASELNKQASASE